MILDDTMALEFSVSSGSAVVFHASAANDTGSAISPYVNSGTSNGVTAVTLVSAPASGEFRTVESCVLRNGDTVQQTLTIRVDVSATDRDVVVCTLQPGESVAYDRGSGRWVTMDSQMRERTEPSPTGLHGLTLPLYKAGTASDAATYWYCTAKDGGFPGAVAIGTPGLGGRAVTGSTEGGAINPRPAPSGNWHLTHAAIASTVIHAHVVFDLLWINSGIVVTTTTAQTVNSVAFPARDIQGTVNGEGCMIGLLVATATTNGAVNNTATVSYTNEAGTAGRTATLLAVTGWQIPATAVAGTIVWFMLAAGDKGVQSIQSVTLATSLGAGAVSLLVGRWLAMVPSSVANVATPALIDADPGVCVWDDPAIFHCYQSSATTATGVSGTLSFADR